MAKINVESSGELYWEFWDGGKVALYTIEECDLPNKLMNNEPWLPVIFEGDPSLIEIVWRLSEASANGVTEQRLRDVVMTYTRNKEQNPLNPKQIPVKQKVFEGLNHLHLGYTPTNEDQDHPYPLYFLSDKPSDQFAEKFRRATVDLANNVLGKDDPHGVGEHGQHMKRHNHPCC
jgi:hypothetical protein